MPLGAQLIAISSVSVGGGTVYPVVGSRLTTRRVGPEAQNTQAYREDTWELTCHAFAASDADVAAAAETARAQLCKRGQAVALTTWTGTRTLPAGGGVGGSLPGYPTVELADDDTRSFGTLLTFTLRCEARVPIPDGGNLVEHDWSREESIDDDGRASATQRGTYRVANGQNAKGMAQTAIIDPAQAAADAADQSFEVSWTLGPDAALARYEYTAADRKDDFGTNVTRAELVDRTTKTNEGRVARQVVGFAEGAGAQAWVDAHVPVPGANQILVRKQTTPATIPDGRINFDYEILTGVVDPQFPNIVVFSFRETVDASPNTRLLTHATYLSRDPVGRYAVKPPSVYSVVSEMEFIGGWADGVIPALAGFNDANLVTTPRVRRAGGPHGLKTVVYERRYEYPTALASTPTPRQVVPIT